MSFIELMLYHACAQLVAIDKARDKLACRKQQTEPAARQLPYKILRKQRKPILQPVGPVGGF